MSQPDDEETFLRELVKASRQKTHLVKWVDRDGTDRQTVLTVAEAAKLNGIAHREKISKGEVLRRAAHVPVAK
jgi:AAA+ ATPase superfamily predicted ATPase